MDIADQLEAAIPAPPRPAPPLDASVARGRRALARRRAAYAVGAVATALVIGGTAWAVSPGDGPGRSGGPGFAEQPSGSAAPRPQQPDDEADPGMPWRGEDAARRDRTGDLEIRPGWTVTRRIEQVDGPGTVGLELSKGERRQWYLFGDAMTISSLHAPEPGYSTFQGWIDVNVPLLEGPAAGPGQGDDEWPGVPRDDLVLFVPRFMSSERGLMPVDSSVTMVDEVFNPDLGESFAPPKDTGAAEVTKGTTHWYVVARLPDDYIAVPADVARTKYGVDDLGEFIEFARQRYAEGGGGLL